MRILGHVEVRSFIVHRGHTRAGVNSDVVIDISNEEFQKLLFSTVKVLDFHGFGRSTSVQLLFEGGTLPDHVKDGYMSASLCLEDVLFSKRPKNKASVVGASQA